MAVRDLPTLGRFLLGPQVDEHPGWLQSVHSSASPLGDFIALGLEQRIVLLAARFIGGKRQLVPVYQGSLHGCVGEDQLTCLLVLPLVSARGAQSAWHATIAGFTSGQVRVYTEAGQLLLQKAFHESAVKRLGVQATPEGKHFTQVLHSQAVQELLVVYPSLVASVSGAELFHSLTTNLTLLARATAEDGEVEAGLLAALPGVKLLVLEQRVEDCASLVAQHTAYSQYTALTMQGGLVDSRHKPVHTAPTFITTGLAPFLVFSDRQSSPGGAGALAHSVVSSVKSGLFSIATGAMGGLWGTGPGPGEVVAKPDPEVTLTTRHALRDEGRQGQELLLSPNKVYCAVRDGQNRLMVVETASGSVVQAWRGYHRVQVAWTVTSLPREAEVTTGLQLAVLLLLYLPRRGLLEVWSPEQKTKVTEFHVSQHGLLLRSCLAALDDGIPRRRETVSLYAAFLPPSGVLQHFYIPFHSLSTSNTAERDLQLQAELRDLSASSPAEVDRMAGLLLDIRNPQLRSQVLSDLLAEEQRLGLELIQQLLSAVRKTFEGAEENVSIENKLWRSKVHKLYRLTAFYHELGREEMMDTAGTCSSPEEELSHALATDLEEVTTLLQVAPLAPAAPPHTALALQDFLSCFETEGDLGHWRASEGLRVRLRKYLAPLLSLSLHQAVTCLTSCRLATAQDHFLLLGLAPEQFLQLAVTSSLHTLDNSVQGLQALHATMAFLLNFNANVDDRHRANCQEVVRSALKRAPMSSTVYSLATVWRCVLAGQGNLTLGVWAEEWSRRLGQVRAFLELQELLLELVPGQEEPCHSLASVFEAGDGRVAELVARWLYQGLATSAQALASALDTEEEVEQPAVRLVARARQHFPSSCNRSVLLLHLAWEQVQAWSRDRDTTSLLSSLLPGLCALPCPALRARLLSLLWRTFFQKLLQDAARLTETLGRSPGSSGRRAASCEELLQLRSCSVAPVLRAMAELLDCQLQSLALAGEGEGGVVQYDCLGADVRPHLLEHVQGAAEAEPALVSLQHQLAVVLELSWSLGVTVRPLHIFSTAETQQLLNTRPGVFSSLFVDHNVAVGKTRVAWVGDVVEAAVGRVHVRPGEGRQYDTQEFQQICAKLQQLARLWFLSDLVKMCQVEQLYRAGHDSLALELRAGVTDVQGLAAKCLEVGLLRVAKHVWTAELQGRQAALPPALLSHLAERKDSCSSVAESGLVDTVALLAWVAGCLEDEDRHSLATTALAAGQVLTVRNNRAS